MLKNQSKNQHKTKFQKLVSLVGQNRSKSSILVFALIVLVGGSAMVYSQVTREPEEVKFASTESSSLINPDEIPGWWYTEHFKAVTCNADFCKDDADPDQDKLTNIQEFYYRSNPVKSDSNSNGLTDGQDVAQGYDPSVPGKVKFEEVISDVSILGESVVFSEDIKKLINDMVDPSKVVLPRVNDSEVKVTDENTKETLVKYFSDSRKILDKHLPKNLENFISVAIATNDQDSIQLMRTATIKAVAELKNLTVPSEAVNFHKYTIMFLTLVPSVINVPDQEALSDEYNEQGNIWYENNRAFAVTMQRLDAEVARFNQK